MPDMLDLASETSLDSGSALDVPAVSGALPPVTWVG
jgi:hypothetical protein